MDINNEDVRSIDQQSSLSLSLIMISFFSRSWDPWNGTRRDDRFARGGSSRRALRFRGSSEERREDARVGDEEKDEEKSMQGDGQEKDATGHGISGTSGEICSISMEREGNERWKERGEGERRLRVGRDATAKEREVYIRYLIRNLRLP